jgi:uroporphyrinogen-III synthase
MKVAARKSLRIFAMQQNKISILSTRPLNNSSVADAEAAGITIDTISFIETEPVRSSEVQQRIKLALQKSATVIFTSMNAVEAVAAEQEKTQPSWTIYCIGNTTAQLVKKYFGELSIAGTANSASELAKLIADKNHIYEAIFFCGDQRRDDLPEILRTNHVEVNEIAVYHTVAKSHKIEKSYNGILFFSPSAVESFFRNNKISDTTILFAIGNTTASEIKKYTDNRIIIANAPGKENLVEEMIKYFA